MKTIKLYGVSAEKFGKEFRLDVESTREAMRLYINSGGRL